MKRLATLILLAIGAFPFASAACEPTSEQMADYFARARLRQENYAADLATKADLIFTGVVIDVTDLANGPYDQLAHIRVEKMLKGEPVLIATAAMHLRNPTAIETGLDQVSSCDEVPDPAREEPYAVKTYRGLYYVKAGVLLRASGFPVGPPPLDPNAEIDLLQRRVPGIRK